MTNEEVRVQIATLSERLGAVAQTANASHSRIDKLDADIKTELKAISVDVKVLLQNMHTQSGSRAAWILVATLGIGLAGALAKILIN